jgi:hypothetical protein
MTKLLTSKKNIAFLLVIATIGLVFLALFLGNQMGEAQKKAGDVQSQVGFNENMTNPLQTQAPKYNVKIENITSDAWNCLGGVGMIKDFFITVKNIGVRDVEGLTFEIKLLVDGNVWESQQYEIKTFPLRQLGILHANESTIISARIWSNVLVSFEGKTFDVSIMLDKTVLDERTLTMDRGFGY